jgi:hypothetical protein
MRPEQHYSRRPSSDHRHSRHQDKHHRDEGRRSSSSYHRSVHSRRPEDGERVKQPYPNKFKEERQVGSKDAVSWIV